MKRLFLLSAIISSCSVSAMPSGVVDQNITQENIHQTICVPGYSKTVRPPASYTGKIKRQWLHPATNTRDYELDHILPISLGGSPRNKGNLYMQKWEGKCGARAKDKDEYRMYRAVCRGLVTLKEAQQFFSPWKCDE